MPKVYLIGGAARVGKSTAMKMFIERHPIPGAATDSIRAVAKSILRAEDNPRLFKFARGKFDSEINIDRLENDHNLILDYEIGESEETWKFVKAFIEDTLSDGTDVIIEGVAILPKLVAKLPFEHRIVYLVNLQDQTDIILEHARNNPHDWLHKYDEQTIRAFCTFNQSHNQYYYEQANKFSQEILLIDNSDFNTSIERAVEFLLET